MAKCVGWITGLFFHLFIHSFNKNLLSIYSCQALHRPWLRSFSGSSQPLGFGGRRAVRGGLDQVAVLPRRTPTPATGSQTVSVKWRLGESTQQGQVGHRLSAHLAVTSPKGEVRKEKKKRELHSRLTTLLSSLGGKQQQHEGGCCHGNPEQRHAFSLHPQPCLDLPSS